MIIADVDIMPGYPIWVYMGDDGVLHGKEKERDMPAEEHGVATTGCVKGENFIAFTYCHSDSWSVNWYPPKPQHITLALRDKLIAKGHSIEYLRELGYTWAQP